MINALFFIEKTFHQIYVEGGSFNFLYHLPQIIYSSLISSIINIIIKTFSLSEKGLLNLKKDIIEKEKTINIKEVLNCLKIKFICFYIISFLFLIFFWYYLACFGAVYKNTQIYLLKDTVISFSLSLLYPIFIYLIPGIFRKYSLKDIKKDRKCIYNLSKIIQSF